MVDVREFAGASVEDAVAKAAKHFGVEPDQIEATVLSDRMQISGTAGRVVVLASIREEPPQVGPTGQFLLDLLGRMDLASGVRVDEYEEEGQVTLRLSGGRLRDLVRRDSRIQGALGHLATRFAQITREDASVRIEIEGREGAAEPRLEEMAQAKAREALARKREVLLPPMNSKERWVVHNALRSFSGLRTESVGDGRLKRVRIVPV